jgi:hypothetical protein
MLLFASFRFEFFASDQSEINRAHFRLVSLPKCFRFASFRFRSFRFALMRNEINVFSLSFRLISFSFRIRCEKNEKNSFFASKRQNFASISLRSENDGIFSFLFRFISLRSENYGSFSLPFCFFSLQSENGNFWLLFSFCFRFVPFSFRFRFLRFASMRNKRKKHCFSHRNEKNFASVSLHFASKRK